MSLRLSLLFSLLVLATPACTNRPPKLPTDLDPLGKQCYQEILKIMGEGSPQLEPPTPLEDGTYLIQWQFSETAFGSCQVDGSGALMMLTRSTPPAPAPPVPTSPETPAPRPTQTGAPAQTEAAVPFSPDLRKHLNPEKNHSTIPILSPLSDTLQT
ncbi:MAG: hypothetical protein AAFV72_00970 [Cyanobacteria bacterium J06635_1]